MKQTTVSTIAIILAGLVFFTCSKDDVKFNPLTSEDETGAIGIVFTSKPDTSLSADSLELLGTQHITIDVNDTLYFFGTISNESFSGQVTGVWIYGDGYSETGFGLKAHAYNQASTITASFIINDQAGNSDTARITINVNTPPQPVQLGLPANGSTVQSLTPTLTWSAEDFDLYDSNLTYMVVISRRGNPADTVAPSLVGVQNFPLVAELDQNDTISWYVVAFDSYGAYQISPVGVFYTSTGTTSEGAVSGLVFRQGRENGAGNAGISVRAFSSGSERGNVTTDNMGAYFIPNLSGTVTLHFTSYGFAKDSTIVVIAGGKTTEIPDVTLMDNMPPVITLSAENPVRAGTQVLVSWSASDTFYTVNSIEADFGAGYQATAKTDTLLLISAPGDYPVRIRAYDPNGNVGTDSIIIHGNFAPDSVQLKSPASDGQVLVQTQVLFQWSAFDRDNPEDLRYTVFMGTTPSFSLADTVVTGWSQTSHQLKGSGSEERVYYWQVLAYDGLDTLASTVDSFTVGKFDKGSVHGWVFREKRGNSTGNGGISVKAYQLNSEKANVTTNDSGYYSITDLFGDVTIRYNDYGFAPDSAQVTITHARVVDLDTIILKDILPPEVDVSAASPVKAGTSVLVSWTASDTLYTLDSVALDFGSGYRTTDQSDSLLLIAAPGDYPVRIKAWDPNGNVGTDSTLIHANFPPSDVTLLAPVNDGEVTVNASQQFSWSCSDPDNRTSVRFTVFVGTSSTLTEGDIKASNLTNDSWTMPNTGSTWQRYYWKVLAYDGFDTLVSPVDSFAVGEFVSGKIKGFAFLEGMQVHNGIRLTANSQEDSLSYNILVDSDGSFFASVLPRNYTLTAEDTLYSVFTSDAASVQVSPGDTADAGTLLLQDIHAPVISLTSLTDGDTLKNLSPRSLTVSGAFTDIGSQVHPDSVEIILNGQPAPSPFITSSSWRFTKNPIPDGRYSVKMYARDGAGNIDSLTFSFYVNSKTLAGSMTIDHDTLFASASSSNTLPQPRAYYWDFDGNGTWDDSSVTSSTSASIQAAIDDYTLSGSEKMIVKVVDDSGMSVTDIVSYSVSTDLPVAHAGNDTGITMGSSIKLHGTFSQKYGHIVKWEWKIGPSSAYVITSSPDTTFTPQSKYDPHYPCVLRITDDNGKVDEDTVQVTVGIQWENVGGIVSRGTSRFYAMDIEWNYTPYIVFTDSIDTTAAYAERVWVKNYNGTSWEYVGGAASDLNAQYVDLAIGQGFGWQGVKYSVYYLAYREGSDVRVKRLNGSVWETAGTTAEINGAGWYDLEIPAMSITSPSIAYRDGDNSDIGVIKSYTPGGGWSIRNTYLSSSWYNNIALSRGGTTVFYDNSGTERLSISSSGSWSTHVISGFSPASSDMVDASDFSGTKIYLSYRDATQSNRVTVKVFNGISWENAGSPGISQGSIWGGAIMKRDSETGDIFLAYHDDSDNGRITVKHFNGTDWVTVGAPGFSSTEPYTPLPALAVRGGQVYVAYRDNDIGRRLVVKKLK